MLYLDCIRSMMEYCEDNGFKHKDFNNLKEIAFYAEPEWPITFSNISRLICVYYGIKRRYIVSKSRKRNARLPRQFLQYYASILTDLQEQEIGKRTGGRTHATVYNSRKRIGSLITTKYPARDYQEYLDLQMIFIPYIELKREKIKEEFAK
jgi:hypothetical protein